MKHIYPFFHLLLAVMVMALPNTLLAQTPPYSTNTAVSTGSNAFPFNSTTNKKTQYLYRPGDLGTVPGGLIDTLWFRNNNTASGTSAGPGTYSNLQIRLGQFTSTVFPGAGGLDFYTPAQLTTVISSPSYTINQTAPAGAWYYIPLPTPFSYDPAQTLVVDVEMDNRTSSSGFQAATASVGSAPNHQRLTSSTNGATTGSASSILADLGISIAPLLGLDAAAQAILSPVAPLSPGLSTQVTINVQNRGSNNLVSATVGYQLDNNPPVIETWSGNLSGFVIAQHTFALPITVPTTQTFNLKVWVTNANGLGPDLNVTNDTLNRSFCIALPGGTYTIGGPTANFATITDAVNIMNCGGIGGAVTFNINPGTYIGSYNIPNLPGASPSSTITFNSATGLASDVILIQDTTTAGNRINFNIAHTARVSFQNLTFRRTIAVTTQAGILSYGNNSGGDVIGCRFEDLTVANSTFNIGVLYNGRGGLIINNSFTGFYYGVFLNGANSNPFVDLNQVVANTFTNYVYRAIYALNQLNPIISNNDISNFIGTSTIGSGIWVANAYSLQLNDNLIDGDMSGYAILLSNLNADTTSVQLNTNRIYNNVINGRQAASLSATTTLALNPIHITGSQVVNATPPNPRDALEIVNNTVYYELNTTSTSTIQAALYVSGGSATAPAFAFMNVRNNHFEVKPIVGELPAAFRLVRFTLLEQLDSLSSSNNNFRIGGSTPPAMFRVNTPATDYATVSAWQTATGKDANSVSINPVFTNATLLLPTSTAFDNLGTPVSYVLTDFAGQARSATTPDIGAYEFVGRIFSQINPTLLSDTLLGPSRSVVASITDSVSTLTSGSARMFYKKASQTVWQLDTIPSISGTNYTFLINYAALGGVQQMDTIQYYIAVLNATNTVTTAPLGGEGLYLSNAVAPLAPHRYQILPVVNGNYRVGISGPADFPTITAATNFLTAGLVTGPVTFTLIDSLYSTAETFPITISQINGSSRTNLVKFVVDSTRTNVDVTGNSNSALVILNGVKNFEWNGSSPSGARVMRVTNTSVAANSCVFNLRSTLAAPLDSVIIQGVRIVGGSNTVTSTFGIHVAGATVSTTTTGDGMYAVRILNNEVTNAYFGIYLRGSIGSPAVNSLIANNRIGAANAATTVNFRGIDAQNLLNSQISGNEVFNITGISSVTRSGIELGGTGSSNVRTTRNLIYEINTPGTSGAHGIFVVSGNGFIIDNNVIRGIRTQNGSAISQTTNAFGIRLGSGSGHKVWYNTVHIYGNYTNANTTGAASAALVISSTVVTGIEIKNNVFSNTMTSVATGTRAFNAIWLPTSYGPTNLDINNNAYHVANTVDHAVGRVGTATTSPLYDDVLAWKGFTSGGTATNDILSVPPTGKSPAPFVSDTVLTVLASTVTGIESGAVVIAALGTPNTDFNNTNRPAGTGIAPDMGAYEFNGVVLPDAFPPTIDSATITPNASQCVVTPRTVTAFVRDNAGGVGVDSVFISYTVATVQQPLILMARSAGTSASGTYTATIPASSLPNQRYEVSVVARDTNGNFTPVQALGLYADDYLAVNAGNDTTINAGDTATLVATVVGFAGTNVVEASRTGGNGSAGVSFNVRAISGVVLDSIYVPIYGTIGTAATVDVWHSTSPVNGAPTINAGPVWTRIVTAGPTTCLNTGFTGAMLGSAVAIPGNLTIPAGASHGFFVQVMSGGSQGYTSHTTALVDTFTDGNIVIYTGPNVGYGGSAPNPTFHPRMFNGSVGYKSNASVTWTELGSTTVLASADTLLATPIVTTTYVATLTDSICTKTDTVTVFVTPNIIDDIGISAILTPNAVSALNQAYTVTVVIENFGNSPATGFDVAFAVNGTELNANAIARTVPAGDTIHHTFTQSWTPTSGGTVNLCAYTKGLSTDVNLANDTSCATFLNVNVEEVNNLVSKVYPVPADQLVNFDFGAQQGVGTLELRDNLGRLVYSTPIDLSTGAMHEVKTGSYAAGVYNYRFVMDSKVQYGQVVVRR
jgi:hypothetical protein